MASKSHRFTGPVHIASQDMYEEEAMQMHALGAVGLAENGDLYRYARVISSGTDLIAGNLHTSLAAEAHHQNIALSVAVSVGDVLMQPTLGATAVDANEYDEGWLIFNDVSPEGEFYKIERHEAAALSTVCDVYLERGIKTLGTTSSEIELVRNPWNNVAISQLITERATGVTVQDWDVSVANFGWLKTRGMASCLSDSTGTTVGYMVAISDGTDGAVGLHTAASAEQEMVVGQMLATGTTGEFNTVYLTID